MSRKGEHLASSVTEIPGNTMQESSQLLLLDGKCIASRLEETSFSVEVSQSSLTRVRLSLRQT